LRSDCEFIRVSGVVKTGKHSEKWIAWIIAALDEHVDEETKAKILEQCGRQCQSESFVRKARKIYETSEDTDEFLDKFGQVYKNLHREGDAVYIIYSRCYCPNVNKIPQESSLQHTAIALEDGQRNCLKALWGAQLR